MRMRISSAGLSWTAPPQARHPPSVSTTRLMSGSDRSTWVSVSIVSAVPAGDVMAREEVFGTVKPRLAKIATTIGVVRFPGRPPTQCLSMTMSVFQSSCSPTFTMAPVSEVISSMSRLSVEQAEIKAAR